MYGDVTRGEYRTASGQSSRDETQFCSKRSSLKPLTAGECRGCVSNRAVIGALPSLRAVIFFSTSFERQSGAFPVSVSLSLVCKRAAPRWQSHGGIQIVRKRYESCVT